ncbi:fimbrial protein [Enterobacter bugandensis]|uniref:fimbrial protein n=1 Tax=Enterobacter bugandensis TaxID=881260 RepID=UPI0022E05579|nr:fimbrial protein [Enterobacter bugandensis]
MKLRIMKILGFDFIVYLLFFCFHCSLANADATVKFHGTLQAGSCSANTVNVEFGTVLVDKINSTSTRSSGAVRSTNSGTENFSITVACTGSVNNVQLKLAGTPTTFSNVALATDVQGLGVIVASSDSNIKEAGGTSTAVNITPNKWYTLSNGAGTYSLMAILLKDKSTALSGGEFNATATIQLQIL